MHPITQKKCLNPTANISAMNILVVPCFELESGMWQ